jgi:ribosomal protein L17
MEQEFKIIRTASYYATRLSLMGDFDATAAIALAEALEKESAAERIVVQTSCIRSVMSGAVEIYSKAFSEIKGLHSRVVFCGERAGDIAPRGAIVYY